MEFLHDFSWLSGVIGSGITIIGVAAVYVMLIRNIRKKTFVLFEGLKNFYEKYWQILKQGPIKQDFKKLVVIPLDELLEAIADLLEKLKFKKQGRRLRDFIQLDNTSVKT